MKTLHLVVLICFVLSLEVGAQSSATSNADKLQAETVSLFNQGKFQEAVVTAKQTIAEREKEVGKQHPKVASDLTNLGAIYYKLGNYQEADWNFEKALKVYEGAPSQNEEAIIKVLKMKAACADEEFEKPRSVERAIKLYQRALLLAEKRYGKEHAEIGIILARLGSNLFNNGQDQEADAAFKRSLNILEKAFGPNDRRLAEPLEGKACLLMQAKKENEAESIHTRVNLLLQQGGQDKNAPLVIPFKLFGCRAIEKKQPDYPSEARDQRVMGKVLVKVEVDETGKVSSASSPFPNRALATVSEEAAKKWRFKPALVNQVPVKVTGYLFFNFILQ